MNVRGILENFCGFADLGESLLRPAYGISWFTMCLFFPSTQIFQMPYKMSYDLGKIRVTYSQDPKYTKLYIAPSTSLSSTPRPPFSRILELERDFKPACSLVLQVFIPGHPGTPIHMTPFHSTQNKTNAWAPQMEQTLGKEDKGLKMGTMLKTHLGASLAGEMVSGKCFHNWLFLKQTPW